MLTESKKCQISGNLNLYKPSWQHHVNDLSIKLNTTNALFFKRRKSVGLI